MVKYCGRHIKTYLFSSSNNTHHHHYIQALNVLGIIILVSVVNSGIGLLRNCNQYQNLYIDVFQVNISPYIIFTKYN